MSRSRGADRLRRRSCLTIEAGLARRRLFNSHSNSNSAGRRRRSAASGLTALTGLDRGDVEKSDQIEAGSRLVSLDVEGKASVQPTHLHDGRGDQALMPAGFQCCGSSSSIRLLGQVGSLSITSLR